MSVQEAKKVAAAAVLDFSKKKPITHKGKVVDHACAAGRVGRLIKLSAKINQSAPGQSKAIAEKRNELQAEAVAKQKAAIAALRAYAAACKAEGVQPEKVPMRRCDCGYCMGSNAGSIDLLWMAESVFRREVHKMLLTESGVPDFGRIAQVEEAYEDYARFAAVFGHTMNMEDIFYSEWSNPSTNTNRKQPEKG